MGGGAQDALKGEHFLQVQLDAWAAPLKAKALTYNSVFILKKKTSKDIWCSAKHIKNITKQTQRNWGGINFKKGGS